MAVGIPLDFSALDARCTCETTWIYSSSLLEAGRLYVATTTVTHNPPNQGGGGWGQDLYRCRCQVFGEVFPSSSPRWAPFLGKAFIIEASHLNLSTCLCELTADFFCWCVQCPGKTPASPWPRVSTFSPPRWTPQETASQGKAAVRGTHVHINVMSTSKAQGLHGSLTWKVVHEEGRCLSCERLLAVAGFCFMHFEQILNKVRRLTWRKRLKVTVSFLF